MPESPAQKARRYKESGFTDSTTTLSLAAAGQSEADAARALEDCHAALADEATRADPLPQLLLGIRRREHAYEQLQTKLRGDDCPASAFAVGRQMLNDI